MRTDWRQPGANLLRQFLENIDVDQLLGRLKNRRRARGSSKTSRMAMQDVLQDALLHALQKGKEFTGATQESAVRWVLGIAQNKERECRRQRRQRGSCWHHGLVDASALELDGLACAEDPGCAGIEANDALGRIEKAMDDCLSKVERLLVLVHDLDGVPLREIARRSGVAASQVSRKHAAALRKLSRELGKE